MDSGSSSDVETDDKPATSLNELQQSFLDDQDYTDGAAESDLDSQDDSKDAAIANFNDQDNTEAEGQSVSIDKSIIHGAGQSSYDDQDSTDGTAQAGTSNQYGYARPPPRPTQTARKPFASKPQCTHMNVVRLFTQDYKCHFCGRVPNIGWIYACEQDNVQPGPAEPLKPRRVIFKSKKPSSLSMEELGFSKSVIDAANAGHYTQEQIEKMKDQKVHVRSVLADAMEEEQRAKKPRKAPDATTDQAGSSSSGNNGEDQPPPAKKVNEDSETSQDTETDEDSDDELKRLTFFNCHKPSKPKPQGASKVSQACNLKACHPCRPMFRDRCCVDLEKALDFDPSEMSQWKYLKVSNARTLRYIGWESNDTSLDVTLSSDTSSVDMTTMAAGPPLMRQTDFNESNFPSGHFTGSGQSGSAEGPDDLGIIHNPLSNKEHDAASSVEPLSPVSSASDEFHDAEEVHSSPKDEVPVREGVALTEEAVETHTPDIIMSTKTEERTK